jgi:hypothetical protein
MKIVNNVSTNRDILSRCSFSIYQPDIVLLDCRFGSVPDTILSMSVLNKTGKHIIDENKKQLTHIVYFECIG